MPVVPGSPRPTAASPAPYEVGAGTENKNISRQQAFNRGKESAFLDALEHCKKGFEKVGDEVLFHSRVMMQKVADEVRLDFTKKLGESHSHLDKRMDVLQEKLQHIILHSSAGVMDGEGKLFHNHVEEKLLQITDQLAHVQKEVDDVPKRCDAERQTETVLGRLDLPHALEAQAETVLRRCTELHLESEARASDLAITVDAMRVRLTQPVVVDFHSVLDEVGKCQRAVGKDVRMAVQEIGKIQRGLNLDYVNVLPETGEVVIEDAVVAIHTDDSESLKKHRRRIREFWTQTENSKQDVDCQTDAELNKLHKKKTAAPSASKKNAPVTRDHKTVMGDADALKEKARKALITQNYNVFDYYHTEGYFQRIAKSRGFDIITVAVVCMNAVWIAIDIDNNPATTLNEAEPVFQVVETLFCLYFCAEIFTRFMAFVKKAHAFRDKWFVFDSILVLNMVVETWLVPLTLLLMNDKNIEKTLNVSMLRILRMVKLLRLSRVSRLLRSVPELAIIVKAITYASRSVAIFFLLWLVIIYLFAVVLRQISYDLPVGDEYFSTVPEAMNTLLLNGLLPDYAPLIHAMGNGSPVLWFVVLVFVLLASLTIMYMLVGVLVDVVSVISTTEKEGITVRWISLKMREHMEMLGYSTESPVTKKELQQLLVETEVCQVLASVNIDVEVLMDMLDVAYEDLSRQGGVMTFEKMIGMMLNARGANPATVRDTKELLRILKSFVKVSLSDIVAKLNTEFAVVHANLKELRNEALERDGYEVEDESENGEPDSPRHGSNRQVRAAAAF
eukprot:gb/GFBE01018533.1/.p1 GENE.gb/GFBE01018533.1/~~gb/GFBE01018533.1/.p1  ORF type:complete len:788 (+),score=188.57 gb/GFBE01018533.1/:1-2364(+)